MKEIINKSKYFYFYLTKGIIFQHCQTFIYFEKLSFLNPFFFFHCIFPFYKGKDRWPKYWARILLILGLFHWKRLNRNKKILFSLGKG